MIHFKYKYNAGPVHKEDITNTITEGNCRLAVQLFYYYYLDQFIQPEHILCPYSYKFLGDIVLKENITREALMKTAQIGDLIFAERITNNETTKNGFEDDNWIVSLHSAIYLGYPVEDTKLFFNTQANSNNILIFHSSKISDGTAIWNLEEFEKHYKIVALKRVIEESKVG